MMHFFESQVVSMSTEFGNGSKLDFLLGYNLPRVTIHITRLNSTVWEQHTDYNLHALRQNSLIRM